MSEVQAVAESRRRFSIVSAVYNVSRYLPEYIASIEQQTHSLDQVEVIVVDDGSTDDSLAVLQAWQARRPDLVRVLTKANGGQGSARNLGLEHVRGEWVTFPDPDDMIDPDYLARVDWAINKRPALTMVATHKVFYFDSDTPEISDSHPQRGHFRRDQFIDLDKLPEFFYGSAPAAFFRAAEIARHDLRFDVRIQPNFEDAHFTQRYLLRADVRLVAFLKTARYLYRKRFDQSSTLQTSLLQAGRYGAVPRHGYLELLEEGAELNHGRAPRWLQNIVIYDLSWLVGAEDSVLNSATACHGEVATEFLELLRGIRRQLDDDAISEFSTRRLRPEWRQVLLQGIAEGPWNTPYVVAQRYDEQRKQVLVSFRFTGAEPSVTVFLRGNEIQPAFTKLRALRYWDHILLRERLMWLPAQGAVQVLLDGRAVELRTEWDEQTTTVLRPAAIRRQLAAVAPATAVGPEKDGSLTRTDRLVLRLAKTAPVKRLFADAWVLMDRANDSGDSGERLFRHLRKKDRNINAWFVVTPDSPDYARLRKEGYRRIIGYGTLRWKLLLLNCAHLISSHADVAIMHPQVLEGVRLPPPWKFTFLQHGVVKDDISSYLNPKQVDLMVSSTVGEHESMVGDDTGYVFTDKEVKRTGLPRFDRLRSLGAKVSEADQNLILVAPTWRSWLAKPLAPGTHRRELVEDFLTTDYAENWFGLLRSEKLAEVCAEHGLRLGFLPHPNMAAALAKVALPPHVDALTYGDNDVQELFARAAVTVTDYSSVVFNSAYIDRPVVYFQFDRERVELGGHVGRKGYFDYERDGFGAVTETLAEAERAIQVTAAAGRRTRAPYDARILEAFPVRDGNCCKRIVAQIRALS